MIDLHTFRENPHVPTSCAICGEERRFHHTVAEAASPAPSAETRTIGTEETCVECGELAMFVRGDNKGVCGKHREAASPLPRWQDIRALIAEWRSSANFIADVLVPTPEGAQDEFRLRNCADALEKLLPAPPQETPSKDTR